MFAEFVDCPKCGKSKSSWPGHYCGNCEDTYKEERFRDASIAYDKYLTTLGEDEYPLRFAKFLRMFT